MRVLVVAMEYPPLMGGGGTYVYNLVQSLSAQGCGVILLTSGEKDESINANKNLIEVRSSELLKLYRGNGNFVVGVDLIINNLIKYKPDVIHSHHCLEKLLVHTTNRMFGLPHIETHHKTPQYRQEVGSNAKLALFDFVNTLNCDYYIAPSQAFEADLIRSGVDRKIIEVSYPGLDPNIYHKILDNDKRLSVLKEKIGISNDDLLVLIPTVVRKRKGIDFILKSISRLVMPGKTIKVLITGLDNENYGRMSKLASPNILVAPKQYSVDEMVCLYCLTNIVVSGTQAEGLGLGLIEALMCECPVVATNSIGVNEVIEDEYNGLLSEFGDEDKFSSNILKILTNESLRKYLVGNGKKVIREKFDQKRQSLDHIRIYDSCLRRH